MFTDLEKEYDIDVISLPHIDMCAKNGNSWKIIKHEYFSYFEKGANKKWENFVFPYSRVGKKK